MTNNQRIYELEKRVFTLENPVKFKKGDKVKIYNKAYIPFKYYFSYREKGIIIDITLQNPEQDTFYWEYKVMNKKGQITFHNGDDLKKCWFLIF